MAELARVLVAGCNPPVLPGDRRDLQDFELVLSCVDCRRCCLLGFGGVAPTLENVGAVAARHECGAPGDLWRPWADVEAAGGRV